MMGKSSITVIGLLLLGCGDNRPQDLRCARVEVTLPPQVSEWPFQREQFCSALVGGSWVPGRPTPYLFRDALARNVNSWNLRDKSSGSSALQAYCEDGKVVIDVDAVMQSANLEIYFTRITESPSAARFDCKLTHHYYDYNAVVVRSGVCRPREDRGGDFTDWPLYSPALSCLWEKR